MFTLSLATKKVMFYSDLNKGINEILYNHLNLPTNIYIDNKGGIEYLYNAAGQIGSVYLKAHDLATPQSGNITEHITLKNTLGGPGLTFPSSVYTNPSGTTYPNNVYSASWESNGVTIQNQQF